MKITLNKCILLLHFVFFTPAFAQNGSGFALHPKNIQLDITSLVLINAFSVYADVDFYRNGVGKDGLGVRLGADFVHAFGLIKEVKYYPVRNIYGALRGSAHKSKITVDGLLIFTDTSSFKKYDGEGDGQGIILGVEASSYIWSARCGIKFKVHYPVAKLKGRTYGYIGLGLVYGLFSN